MSLFINETNTDICRAACEQDESCLEKAHLYLDNTASASSVAISRNPSTSTQITSVTSLFRAVQAGGRASRGRTLCGSGRVQETNKTSKHENELSVGRSVWHLTPVPPPWNNEGVWREGLETSDRRIRRSRRPKLSEIEVSRNSPRPTVVFRQNSVPVPSPSRQHVCCRPLGRRCAA